MRNEFIKSVFALVVNAATTARVGVLKVS